MLQTERFQLPAPIVEEGNHYTRVVLFGHRPLSGMDRSERVQATYLHAFKYVNREYVTNSSLRERFGIEARNSARVSRLLAEAVSEGVIVPDNPTAARKQMRYAPWWTEQGD